MIFMELRARDPHMLRWVELMARTGGSRVKVKYDAGFFCWLDDQILMIKDHTYAGIDFRGDPDLPLPLDAQWGDIGKKQDSKMLIVFFVFSCFNVFYEQ